MSNLLNPGTLCLTVGGSGENAGRLVRVIRLIGASDFGRCPAITEGYCVETADGKPFASVEQGTRLTAPTAGTFIVRNIAYDCVADRRNLRPLVDPSVERPDAHARALIADAILAPLVAEWLSLMNADDRDAEDREHESAPVQT
jgi:hypothetical protein